jgi:hypothetical protein
VQLHAPTTFALCLPAHDGSFFSFFLDRFDGGGA